MSLLLALSLLLNAAVVFGFLRHLKGRDERETKERAELLQRIQAPEMAVTAHAMQPEPELPEAVHPEDDLDYWKAHGVEVET